jgi:hypothetical protein
VLDTIVQTARRLCGADRAIVTMLRDGKYHLLAHDGAPPDVVESLSSKPFLPDRGSSIGRAALERKAAQIPNVLVDAEWTGLARERVGKVRTYSLASGNSSASAGCPAPDFRQPSGDRHREHAPVPSRISGTLRLVR